MRVGTRIKELCAALEGMSLVPPSLIDSISTALQGAAN